MPTSFRIDMPIKNTVDVLRFSILLIACHFSLGIAGGKKHAQLLQDGHEPYAQRCQRTHEDVPDP